MNVNLFIGIIGILIVFALFPLKQEVFAKCAYAKYTITGTVQDDSTGQVVSNATLFFFFDNNQSTFSGGPKYQYPDFFTTDTNGMFVATAFFNTFSGGWFFDRCNRKPKNLTVVITASGYLTKRVIFKRKDLTAGGGALDRTIELPAIVLYPSKH